jgi:transcriptional regulator with XRE-family HTH domain
MTSEAILRRLSMEFPHLQVLTTTERLEQALGWLDLKGMAIRRQANRWWVGGQAATQYVNVDVGAWPPRFRAEWEELTQRPLSGWVVAQRIRLIMRMNGILAGELDPLATVNLLNWENGKIIVDSENFVLGLERWAERLGVDPIFLRTGTCRTLMEERVLPTLRHMTHNGRRLKSLRHLEGTTQKELAKESGVSHERIDEMEHGGAERSSGWERLGKGLGRSHFFILGGMGEDELMTARMPEYRRYHIIRQAYGLAQFAIADALGLQRGVVVDWDHRIPRRIAAEFYAWIRKAQSAKTTHQKIAALLARGA